ncbi:MAG: hypothetical protein V1701_09285 [Planctomycetota bacterium]
MKEERMKILKMLGDKKITPEEASQLLEALDESEPLPGETPHKDKYLKVRVYENNMNEPKVNVDIPLGWGKGLSGFIMPQIEEKLKAKGYSFNIKELMDSIAKGQTQKIVDIKDGNDKIEVYIE